MIGTAATINTGSVDDLNGLADICQREKLWFHVDGAIGAVLPLSPTHRALVAGMERADSVALDLHKWLQVPFEAGCAIVRDRNLHRGTFALTPEYLEHTERGLASGPLWFSEYGLQLSRGFRALKVWLSFKEHGVDRYGRLIDQTHRAGASPGGARRSRAGARADGAGGRRTSSASATTPADWTQSSSMRSTKSC